MVDAYLNKKRDGNIIYGLEKNGNYIITNLRFKHHEYMMKVVSQKQSEGYKVYFNEEVQSKKGKLPKRSPKRK